MSCDAETAKKRALAAGQEAEKLQKRLDTYNNASPAIFKEMQKLGKYVEINANRSAEAVRKQVYNELEEKLFGKRNSLPYVVFVMGGPGSQKVDHCKKITEALGLPLLCTGEVLREEAAVDSERGQQVKQCLENKDLVPHDVMVELLYERLEQLHGVVLVEGFPRNQEMLDVWNTRMKDVCQLAFAVNFQADEAVQMERLKAANPDDESAEKRVSIYTSQTKPVAESLAKQTQVMTVDANKAFEEVCEVYMEDFRNMVLKVKNSVPKVVFMCGGPGSGKVLLKKFLMLGNAMRSDQGEIRDQPLEPRRTTQRRNPEGRTFSQNHPQTPE